MSYRNLLTVSSVLAFIFGLGFILLPGQLLGLYNVQLEPAGILIARLYGGTLFGFGVLNWFARGFGDSMTQQAVLIANFVGDALGFIFSLLGQLGGVPEVNALGWSTVLIYLLLALGFGYLRFFSR